jgi:type IV pilus assembly protein PilC
MRYQRLVMDAGKRVVSALVYPAVLIGLSILMLLVMAIYVVPSFAKFYDDLGAELPALTQITLAISFFLRDHFLILSALLIAAVVTFRTWLHSPAGRRSFDTFKLRLPLLGSIFHRFALSEYTRSLATLLAGGIPLVSALETSTDAVGNIFISTRLRAAIGDVRQGTSLHVAVERTETFPHMAVNMLKVGEATGALDEMLNSIGDYFDEFVETRVQRLLSLVEPVMLVVMGMLIAVLLISIYLPMFGALSQMN